MSPEAYDTAAPILDRPAGPDTGKGQGGKSAARRAEGLRPPPPRRAAAPPPPSPGRRHARGDGATATRRRWVRLGAALGAVLVSPVLALAALVLLSAPAERPRHGVVAVGPGRDVAEAETSRSAVGTWGGGATNPTPLGADPASATPADLSLELARLRAAVAAEGERLAALERRRDMLLASIEALQGKAPSGSLTATGRSPEEGDEGGEAGPHLRFSRYCGATAAHLRPSPGRVRGGRARRRRGRRHAERGGTGHRRDARLRGGALGSGRALLP